MNNQPNYDEALSNMITPNNTQPTTFKTKKPPPIKNNSSKTSPTKKSSKTSKNTNTQKQNKNPQNTKNKTQTTNKKMSLTKPSNPNKMTKQEVSQVNQVNNETPLTIKNKDKSQKDFKKAQIESNNKKRPDLFKGVLENINQEKTENGLPIMSLQRFTTITNSIMKVINDSNYLVKDNDNITNILVNEMDMIDKTISSKSVNTQRKIITDIITILNTDDNIKMKDVKKYEYLRKDKQLQSKTNE